VCAVESPHARTVRRAKGAAAAGAVLRLPPSGTAHREGAATEDRRSLVWTSRAPAQSLKYIPLGAAYAIWSGLGMGGSVLLGLLIWKEILGSVHIFGIALIVGGVVVLDVALFSLLFTRLRGRGVLRTSP
jgi:hypothetical protein